MRVGLVVYGSLQQQTGGYLYDRMLVHHLRSAGHEVRIFSLPDGTYTEKLTHRITNELQTFVSSAHLQLLLHDELCHPSHTPLRRTATSEIPVVSIVHHLRCAEPHPWPQRIVYRAVEKYYLRAVDGFIYNSFSTQASVEHLQPAARKRPSVVVWPGRPEQLQDAVSQTSRPGERDSIRLLFVGSIIERKGLLPLSRALRQFSTSTFSLHIVGDDTVDPAHSRKVHHELTTTGQPTYWHGAVSDKRLQELYSMADAFVMPSFYEGFGIAYLEAMGYGLPVIATIHGGATDFIQDRMNGLLCDPNDPASIMRALRLLHDPQERRYLAKNANESVRKHPTWKASMQRVAEFMETMVNS